MLPALLLLAQIGLKAGVPLTEYFETGASSGLHGNAAYSAATRRYTLGASAEWRKRRWGLELDALYHRMGYVAIVHFFDSANGSFRDSAIDAKGNSWDFPLMLKFHSGRLFLAGGGVLRRLGPVRGRGSQTIGSLVTGTSVTTPLDTTDPSELHKRFYPGVAAAAGLEFRAARVRVAPEIRSTRWTANIGLPGSLLRFPSNQFELLIGISR